MERFVDRGLYGVIVAWSEWSRMACRSWHNVCAGFACLEVGECRRNILLW